MPGWVVWWFLWVTRSEGRESETRFLALSEFVPDFDICDGVR